MGGKTSAKARTNRKRPSESQKSNYGGVKDEVREGRREQAPPLEIVSEEGERRMVENGRVGPAAGYEGFQLRHLVGIHTSPSAAAKESIPFAVPTLAKTTITHTKEGLIVDYNHGRRCT